MITRIDMIKRNELETEEKWEDLIKDIEPFELHPSMTISVIPPYRWAITRFVLGLKGTNKRISVYYDVYQMLGYFDHQTPYYEAYPIEGDTFRSTSVQEIIDVCYKELKNE